MFGVNIIILSSLFYIFSALNPKIKYFAIFIIFAIFSLPLPQYSANLMLYSFFGEPCYFIIFLSIFFIFYSIDKDFNIFGSKFSINIYTILLILFYNTILFLGLLGFLPFDIFHSGIILNYITLLFIFILIIFLDKISALILVLSIFFSIFSNDIFNIISCVYLYLFCLLNIFIKICEKFKSKIKKYTKNTI